MYLATCGDLGLEFHASLFRKFCPCGLFGHCCGCSWATARGVHTCLGVSKIRIELSGYTGSNKLRYVIFWGVRCYV